LVDSTRRTEALADRESALIRSGGQLWGLNCASCHGTTGEGEDAPALNSQQFLEITSDEQMHRIIAAGITGAKMPAWWNEFGGPLTDEQITAIVAYVRSWEPSAPDRPDWRSAFEGGGG
jgi:cytochrome c oxidase cbb3-type subunit 3